MKPRVCICCGETMVAEGNKLSRNPNLCASCSSMADGLEQEEAVLEVRGTDETTHAESTGNTDRIRHLQSVLPG